MQKEADIFAAWPCDAELGRDIGVPYPRVSAWKQRGSILAAYRGQIIRAAARRGYPEITADLLARVDARNVCDNPGFAQKGQPTMLEAPERPVDSPNGGTAAGHFSRSKHLRRAEEIAAYIGALPEEGDRR
jgi:hypothetical protein